MQVFLTKARLQGIVTIMLVGAFIATLFMDLPPGPREILSGAIGTIMGYLFGSAKKADA